MFNQDKFSRLVDMISEISDDLYCASWLKDIEYTVWLDLHRNRPDSIPKQDAVEMIQLASDLDGWCIWDDTLCDPVYIQMSDWIPKVLQHQKKHIEFVMKLESENPQYMVDGVFDWKAYNAVQINNLVQLMSKKKETQNAVSN